MNIFDSIFKYKCPKCRQGDLYKKPFRFSNPLDMNEQCDICGQKFEPEPGYYFGAMFVSYIWTAFTALFIVGFTMLVLGWSLEAAFGLLILISALSFFWVARVSRSMYIHLDVKYDPDAVKHMGK